METMSVIYLEYLRLSNDYIILPVIVLLREVIHRLVFEVVDAGRSNGCPAYPLKLYLLCFIVYKLDEVVKAVDEVTYSNRVLFELAC